MIETPIASRIKLLSVSSTSKYVEQDEMIDCTSRATRRSRIRELSSNVFRYACIPMLIVDSAGDIANFNIACSELMGTDLGGTKHRNWKHLCDRVQEKVEGSLFPDFAGVDRAQKESVGVGELRTAVSTCSYKSAKYGIATLRTSVVPGIDRETGHRIGSMVQVEVLEIDQKRQFQESLEERWRHELMWDVYAASYDRVLPHISFYQEVVDRHCRAMSQPGIQDILDVGAGTGNVTVRLLGQGKRVTAVDVGTSMLEKLFRKLGETTEGDITVIEDSAESLPELGDGSFDGVTALLAFFDMQNPFAALSEAMRLLKPGGTLILTEPKECFNVEELMNEAERVLRERGLLQTLQEDWIRVQTVKVILNQTIQQIQHPGETSECNRPWNAETASSILRDGGFEDLTMDDSHLGNCATITAGKPLN